MVSFSHASPGQTVQPIPLRFGSLRYYHDDTHNCDDFQLVLRPAISDEPGVVRGYDDPADQHPVDVIYSDELKALEREIREKIQAEGFPAGHAFWFYKEEVANKLKRVVAHLLNEPEPSYHSSPPIREASQEKSQRLFDGFKSRGEKLLQSFSRDNLRIIKEIQCDGVAYHYSADDNGHFDTLTAVIQGDTRTPIPVEPKELRVFKQKHRKWFRQKKGPERYFFQFHRPWL